MPGLGVLLLVGLLVLLPQLAGLIATRFVRSSSWTAWPAAAIAVFGLVYYWWLWVPARDAAVGSFCTMWAVALHELLVKGLIGHLVLGILCGRVARRLRARRVEP